MIELITSEGVAVAIALILREIAGLIAEHRRKVRAETAAIEGKE